MDLKLGHYYWILDIEDGIRWDAYLRQGRLVSVHQDMAVLEVPSGLFGKTLIYRKCNTLFSSPKDIDDYLAQRQ